MNRISFQEVLKTIDQSNRDGKITPFSIGIVEWDKKEQKGGKKLKLKHAC
jgi:hypothetical protein